MGRGEGEDDEENIHKKRKTLRKNLRNVERERNSESRGIRERKGN